MSPPEIDLAPELIEQVLGAVDQGFDRQLAFTQQMMALDSTRGKEHQAQACFFEALESRGYEMDQWSIDIA
ncbi:MAG TPA: acetylornithine deacetylase, partial [Gammaproteobacteria bacterium]|nr:acetylornithine deacetylase [Gammaproteobacteria bacterium]